MDSDILFYIAAGLFYLALNALGSKKKKEQAKQRQQEGSQQELPQSLGEALQEIRRAMSGEMSKQAEAPRPTSPPPALSLLAQATRDLAPPPSGLTPDQQALKARLKKKHKPAATSEPTKEFLPAITLGLPEVKPVTKVADNSLRNRLRDPEAVREAYVVSEILGPPRARRRR